MATPATPETFRPIPLCPSQTAGESNTAYGQRCLQFMLQTNVFVTVDDEGLALADRVAITAVTAPDLAEATRATISACRTTIARFQAVRRMLQAEAAQDLGKATAILADDRPNLGPMAPLPQAPIVPTAPAAGMPSPRPQAAPRMPIAKPQAPKPAPMPAPLGQLSSQFAGTEF